MQFIHLSDLHIHGSDSDNQGISDALSFIAKTYPQHHLIITGDITDDGSEKQFKKAYELLKPFCGRVFICPGNHDFGAVGNIFSPERARRFDECLAKPLDQGGTFMGDSTPVVNFVRDGTTEVMLIALDSNLETESLFDFACGEIGAPQLRAVETILSTTPNNAVKILFFHHHPFTVNDPFMELKDAKELARAVFGRTDVMLFGHKHVMKQWENRWGTKFILASDNSSDKIFAKEISVTGTNVTISSIPIRAV